MKHQIESDPIANAFAAAQERRQKAVAWVMDASSQWVDNKTDGNLRHLESAVREMLASGDEIEAIASKVAPRRKP